MQQLELASSKLGATNIIPLEGGNRNILFLAEVGGKKVVVKFHSQAEFEATVQQAMHALDLAPQVYDIYPSAEAGSSFFTMAYVNGVSLNQCLNQNIFSPEHFYRLGQFIWQIQQPNGLSLPRAVPFSLDVMKIAPYLDSQELTQLITQTTSYNPALLPAVTAHGDFQTKNIFITNQQGILGIDWEATALDSRYQDIGWFIWYCTHHHRPYWQAIAIALIAGYEDASGTELQRELIINSALQHVSGVVQDSILKSNAEMIKVWIPRLKTAINWGHNWQES